MGCFFQRVKPSSCALARALAVATALLAAWGSGARPGQAADAPLQARRLLAPVAIDGAVESEAWGAAPTLDFLSDLYRPLPARARTRVWVGFDEESLALAWACDEPGLNQDRPAQGADWPTTSTGSLVQARLSVPASKGREARLYLFRVDPRNTRYAEKDGEASWKGPWACGVKADKGFWSAEMTIPFSSLGIAKSEDRKGLGVAFVRRVRGRESETQGWPVQLCQEESQPLAALSFAEGAPRELEAWDRIFWTGWPARIADFQTSASALLQRADPEDSRLWPTRRLLSEALDRAGAVDPQAGLRPGASEPSMRSVLEALEARMRLWLSDLSDTGSAPSAPDRIVPLELPAPSGAGQAQSWLLFCGADQPGEPAPLVVNLHPGDEPLEAYAERFMRWRGYKGEPFLMLLPEGGGAQSGHAYEGEDEILQAIEAVKALYPVDEGRVYLLGYGMGAMAAQRLASHMPGRFAAAAAIAGAGPVDFVENLGQLPVFLYQGAEDKQVPLIYNLAWDKRRGELKAPGGLTTFADAGHDILERVVSAQLWEKLFAISKPEQPHSVHFRAPSLRYNQAYWARIDRFAQFPPQAVVDLRVLEGNRIEGETRGAAAISVELSAPLISPDENVSLALNGTTYYEGPYRPVIQAELAPPSPGALRKTTERGGPLDEAFHGPALYVWGTTGDAQWTEALRAAAAAAAQRPGFQALRPAVPDTQLSADQLTSANLFLFGGPGQNRLVGELAQSLPVSFGPEGLGVGGQTFGQSSQIAQFVWPSPFSAERYVVIHWAPSIEAMRSAPWFLSPLRFHLLPDGVIDRIEGQAQGRPVRRRVAEWWFAEDWGSPSVQRKGLWAEDEGAKIKG